jgi:hypothetical protein
MFFKAVKLAGLDAAGTVHAVTRENDTPRFAATPTVCETLGL